MNKAGILGVLAIIFMVAVIGFYGYPTGLTIFYPVQPPTDDLAGCETQHCDDAGGSAGYWEDCKNLSMSREAIPETSKATPSRIPDQSTPILDLAIIPGLSRLISGLSVTEMTGMSSVRGSLFSGLGIWLLLVLTAVSGIGAAISHFFESHLPEIIHHEPSEEKELEELLEKANTVVFFDLKQAERIYNEINRIFASLSDDIQRKYKDKVHLLYDKMMLELKKEQAQQALANRQVENAEKLIEEIDELYERIREREPERKIPKLSPEPKKSHEIAINKIHDLITGAKQDLVDRNVDAAKQKADQIILLYKELPESARKKLQYEIGLLAETVENR
jgi:hypothetical protein